MADPNDGSFPPPADWRDRFIAAALARNPGFRKCANCTHTGKSISDSTVMLHAWREGRTQVDEGFLAALVACDNCGNIELFSLEALGIEEIAVDSSWQTLRSRSFAGRSA